MTDSTEVDNKNQRSRRTDFWVLHELSFAQKRSDLFAQCANSAQTIRLFCTDLWLAQHAQHAHNMRTTCEEVPDNECSLYFNQFKIGVQVLFHRSPCHSWQASPSQLNLASVKNPCSCYCSGSSRFRRVSHYYTSVMVKVGEWCCNNE